MSIGTGFENIERAEKLLGVRLPADLRNAYSLANRPLEIEVCDNTWWTFPVFDPDNASKTADHLVYENHKEQRWERFPAGAIAIASDGCGNLLALVIREAQASEEISLWDHETGELARTNVTVSAVLTAARSEASRISALQERWRK